MFEFLKDIGNYEERKVQRTEVGNLVVSTVFTSDEGFETAILDDNGAYPVERYSTHEISVRGHEKWCEKAKTLTKVTQLSGFNGLAPEKEITLKR